jgi:hypothetical protein
MAIAARVSTWSVSKASFWVLLFGAFRTYALTEN